MKRAATETEFRSHWTGDEVPLPLVVTDKTLNPIRVNRAWNVLRRDDQQVGEGAEWLSVLRARDRARVRAWLNGVLEARVDDTLEVRGGAADQWLEIRAAPGDDPDGGLIVIALDITAQ